MVWVLCHYYYILLKSEKWHKWTDLFVLGSVIPIIWLLPLLVKWAHWFPRLYPGKDPNHSSALRLNFLPQLSNTSELPQRPCPEGLKLLCHGFYFPSWHIWATPCAAAAHHSRPDTANGELSGANWPRSLSGRFPQCWAIHQRGAWASERAGNDMKGTTGSARWRWGEERGTLNKRWIKTHTFSIQLSVCQINCTYLTPDSSSSLQMKMHICARSVQQSPRVNISITRMALTSLQPPCTLSC